MTSVVERLVQCVRLSGRRVALVVGTVVAIVALPGDVSGSSISQGAITGFVYEADCNDPDGPLPTWLCAEPPRSLLPPGYPYYVGHDEPRMQFVSPTPGSGNNFQWNIHLPQTDPTPTQDGSVVANWELYSNFWLSLGLCDPASSPFGACTPNSDTNPASAGSAFLELQFYPPGANSVGSTRAVSLCSDSTKWCSALTIDAFTGNPNCFEPVNGARVTTDATPNGPSLLMTAGDTILITIKDTASGLETDVDDLTTGNTGSMIASTANGFTQTDPTTCSTSPYAFHPKYLTASVDALVQLAFEIGHWELCGDAACAIPPDSSDSDDTFCATLAGIGGCINADLDLDGVSYIADWPDGSGSHPAAFSIGNPLDNGMGPLSFFDGRYQAAYPSMAFKTNTTGTPGGAFYPFFSQTSSCLFNFGAEIPGTTANDFGKRAQYGTAIDNPCTGQMTTTTTTTTTSTSTSTTTKPPTTTTTTPPPGCADFPCGDDEVSICHIPPGNPGKSQTLCIGLDAVPAHLNHGDHCGPCR